MAHITLATLSLRKFFYLSGDFELYIIIPKLKCLQVDGLWYDVFESITTSVNIRCCHFLALSTPGLFWNLLRSLMTPEDDRCVPSYTPPGCITGPSIYPNLP
jgi:hypothetical protein